MGDAGSDADADDAGLEADIDDGGSDSDQEDAGSDADIDDDGAVIDADIDDPGPVEGPCRLFTAGEEVGRVNIDVLDEISGVAESRRHRGVLYLENDSASRLFFMAVNLEGTRIGEFRSETINPRDLEDLAIGPGPDGSDWVYLADIGDNGRSRSEIIVYRIPEPDSPEAGEAVILDGWESLRFEYPDRPHDAETMFVDPLSGDLYILTKEGDGASHLVVARAPHDTESRVTLEHLTTITFGEGELDGNRQTTAGDMSPAGDSIVIRTYSRIFLWIREPGVSVADAMDGPAISLPRASERQGEAIGFAGDGRGYFTVSEGLDVPIFFFAAAEPCI